MNNILTLTSDLEDILVPLGVCVVLPCLIVFLSMWARRNEVNRKAEVAMKAIEKGLSVDNSFLQSDSQEKRSVKMRLFGLLKGGLVCIAIGLGLFLCNVFDFMYLSKLDNLISPVSAVLGLIGTALLAAFFIGRKYFSDEIEAEEKRTGNAE